MPVHCTDYSCCSCGLETKPQDGTKSNPSKRHRDRLNGELDKLAALLPLPEEVRARLDKLSVLRLSNSGPEFSRNGVETTSSLASIGVSEGDLLLQALNGFVLVVSTDGCIVYASPTIQNYLGFHQSDVLHQSVFDLIHVDDRFVFRCQLHFALDPEASIDEPAGSERIPPENSFQGRLKYLHTQDRTTEGKASSVSQLALFAIATPVQSPAILEIRTKTLFFQSKHKLDFTPVGMDTRGKVVLGYTEQELCMRGSGYQFIHAADMMYCADKHVHMMKTGESGISIFRLLSKTGVWVWVQSNARLVLKEGKPDFIICDQKPLTNEEGEEHLRQRQLQLPFNFATGEGLLYETLPSVMIPGRQDHSSSTTVHPDSLLGSLLSQDRSVYNQPPEPASPFSLAHVFMDSPALLSIPNNIHRDFTSQTVPDTDDGVLKEQLKEMEAALLQLQEKEPIQLSDILANDVFSYVEDALSRETDTTGRHQNSVLPGNPIMRCEYSSSHSQKLIESDFYRQKAPERECANDSQDYFGTLKSFPHPPNTCRSIPGHFPIPYHNNRSSSIQKTGMVSSDPFQNNHLPPSVPGRPFSVNIQHAVHRGALPPWQPHQHAIPLTLQRSRCVQNDCITHNAPVTQHPQDTELQKELCGTYAMNHGLRSHISQNSSLSSSSFSYQRCTLSSNETFSGLHITGSVDTDCSRATCPGTSGLSL
ncbi:Aryl hydrocarbon receptor [Labeo rohita]|uniref:Aryl hydrocarbon receptor n=1 Tax=Labeo rohita TaxID=84645 RepID=A0ABQ8MBN3_LABRO|nr:Aryl hydrocarbon receptor [Labeo rohita]